jgi:hypothetical protein
VHLKRAVRRGKAQLVIVHPRKRGTHPLQWAVPPGYAPGSEVTLLNGLLLAPQLKDDAASEARKLATDATTRKLRSLCGVAPEEAKAAPPRWSTPRVR